MRQYFKKPLYETWGRQAQEYASSVLRRIIISDFIFGERASEAMGTVKVWLTFHWTWFHVRGIRDFTIATRSCNSTRTAPNPSSMRWSYLKRLRLPEGVPPIARLAVAPCPPPWPWLPCLGIIQFGVKTGYYGPNLVESALRGRAEAKLTGPSLGSGAILRR